ncbi:hypothetical protein CRG98_037190 [Punica granatum]|uniref:Uncharacterized protein n=1 Tax=Punica granatum TaxID=22663 RepID=A0A2I0IEK6_PUNGR|nr:hypothetical protein CRG98_037190 [Punica granatum]
MKLLRRCSAPGVVVCLICRKPALLLRRLLVALPDVSSVAVAIVVRWRCPGRAMKDSSSVVERLRIPRGRKSEGLDARPPGLLLALHGHIETFLKVPKRLYRLFDAPVNLGPFSSGYRRAVAFVTRMRNFVQIWSPRGVFDLPGPILLPLEFARAEGSNDSISECITFCLRRGVATAASLFVGISFLLDWGVSVLLFFTVGKARFALRCRSISMEKHASRLIGLFDCLYLRLRGGYIFVGNLPHRRPEADVRSKPNAVNAGPEPDAGPGPDAGPKPNEINVGAEPDAELKLYAINAGPEPDVGSKPNAVNAGLEPDAGLKQDAEPKPDAINAGLIGKCKKCESKGQC